MSNHAQVTDSAADALLDLRRRLLAAASDLEGWDLLLSGRAAALAGRPDEGERPATTLPLTGAPLSADSAAARRVLDACTDLSREATSVWEASVSVADGVARTAYARRCARVAADAGWRARQARRQAQSCGDAAAAAMAAQPEPAPEPAQRDAETDRLVDALLAWVDGNASLPDLPEHPGRPDGHADPEEPR